jgi:hypothetical protein
MRSFAAAVLVSALVLGAGGVASAAPPHPARSDGKPARMSDEAELAQAVGLFEAGKYAQCADELAVLLDPKSREPLRDPEVIATARIYHASCLIGGGRTAEADQPLRDAILTDPQMKPPDPLVFPGPVVERFLRVRDTLHEEIRKAEQTKVDRARREAEQRARKAREQDERVRALEEMASREVVIVRNRRWLALIPFGVGQFQNGNPELGWVFLTSEIALGATALTALAMQTHFTLEAHEVQNPDNNAVLKTWNTLLDVSAWAFVGVAALGITEAQLSFVPERREERKRPIPPSLRRKETSTVRVLPNLRADPHGFSLGVSGRF